MNRIDRRLFRHYKYGRKYRLEKWMIKEGGGGEERGIDGGSGKWMNGWMISPIDSTMEI